METSRAKEISQEILRQKIAEIIKENYDYISKYDTLEFVKSIYGQAASLKDIVTAYNSIDWNEQR